MREFATTTTTKQQKSTKRAAYTEKRWPNDQIELYIDFGGGFFAEKCNSIIMKKVVFHDHDEL